MAQQMWAGRFAKTIDQAANDFNASIRVDCRMYRSDIVASIAHAGMLGAQGIIDPRDAERLQQGLADVLADLESGALQIDPQAEDIHMFVEQVLTERLGDVGKRLHTARSRNDQVATDLRLHLMEQIDEIDGAIRALAAQLVEQAERYADDIMTGYTHLQRAQPISVGHYFLAYVQMLLRDCDRLADCRRRTSVCPLGACALAGTTYPIDRQATARALGFAAVGANSIDCVSDRDFVIELAADVAMIMMHLSRLAEEVILWCSSEFGYMELDDAFATGSSIMPQKKNPDIAELVRGKTGRAYGNLMTLLSVMKGLPLAYNKDMQEDKESIFDSVDTVLACLRILTPMFAGAKLRTDVMAKAAEKGFINATDCADYLTKKGVPFRQAYKTSGQLVAYCIAHGKSLNELSLDEFRSADANFDEDIYRAIDLRACAASRISEGGGGVASVRSQIAQCKLALQARTE